jgi:hypothetical protein
MKTRDVDRNPTGFWARLGAAIAAVEMTPVEFLEIRVARLEREMSRLIEAGRRTLRAHLPLVFRFALIW